jgi:hypothetical protein
MKRTMNQYELSHDFLRPAARGKLFPLSLDRTESEAADDILLKQNDDSEDRQQCNDADDRYFTPSDTLRRDQFRNHDWQRLHTIAAEHERE